MNTGRPLEYDPAEALDAAMQAFWRRGYQGTSMRELLDATGLSKSSFYQAFGSKEGAFEQALVQYCDATAARSARTTRRCRVGIVVHRECPHECSGRGANRTRPAWLHDRERRD